MDHQADCIGGEEGSPMFAEDRNFGEGQEIWRGGREVQCSFSDQMPKFFISFDEVDQLGV